MVQQQQKKWMKSQMSWIISFWSYYRYILSFVFSIRRLYVNVCTPSMAFRSGFILYLFLRIERLRQMLVPFFSSSSFYILFYRDNRKENIAHDELKVIFFKNIYFFFSNYKVFQIHTTLSFSIKIFIWFFVHIFAFLFVKSWSNDVYFSYCVLLLNFSLISCYLCWRKTRKNRFCFSQLSFLRFTSVFFSCISLFS